EVWSLFDSTSEAVVFCGTLCKFSFVILLNPLYCHGMEYVLVYHINCFLALLGLLSLFDI
ncbi:TPA: hypothetical protein ACPGW0_001898, partial [Haemophilus influenzae]